MLFPAVSATDDLHAAQLAVEASDVARKVLRGMNTVSSSGAIDWLHFLPALLLVAMVVALRRRFFAALPERRATLLSVEFLSSSEGRAPPACSHA
ncbi:MAG TPA: hypothetical protein VKT29_01615 [Terriglobales bacterium]|nr:hypothetical protein [Terriglobales bacterium]